MWIRELSVRHFAGIRSADVELDQGLNVLYGPNELGKSTLVRAIRAALLLQDSATAASDFVDWHTDHPPQVSLTLETEPQRIWRIRKSFGRGAEGSSYLEFSRDGATFTQEAKGREVDGRIRELLRWGLPAPGGKGRKKGFSESFLSTTLLADQDDVTAVLRSGLDDDSDESGKRRLTEALQALAEDPVFQAVFAATQKRVDEAFTSTGQRSRRRGSPWVALREQRQAAEKRRVEVRAQASESEGARRLVDERLEKLNDARSQLDNARRIRDRLETVWTQQHARVSASDAVSVATQERDRIQGLHDELNKAQTDLADSEKTVHTAEKSLAEAVAEEDTARVHLEAARTQLNELESGDAEQKRTIRKQEIEKNRLENRSRRTELEAMKVDASTVREMESKTEQLRADLTERAETLAQARSMLEQAREKDRGDDTEVGRIAEHLLALRLIEARTELAQAGQEAGDADRFKAEANAKSERAGALRTALEGLDLPSVDQLDRLTRLQTDLRIAEEKLHVGISVEIRPTRPISVTTRADEGQPQTAELTEPALMEAAAHLSLELEDVAEIDVQGGSRDASDMASKLRAEWVEDTSALFARLKVGDLDDLVTKCRAGEKTRAEADGLAREAEQATEKAAALADASATIAEGEREVDRLEEQLASRLGDRDLQEYVKQCASGDDMNISALEEKRELIRSARELRSSQAGELEQQVSKDEGILETKQADLASQEKALKDKRKAINSPWKLVLERAESELNTLNGEDGNLAAELEALQTGAGDEIERSRAAAQQAEAGFGDAKSKGDEYRRQVAEAQRNRDGLAGEVKTRKALVDRDDLSVAQEALDAVVAKFEQLPVSETEVTESDRAQADEAVRRWSDECEAERAELQKAEGALQQVGGHYIHEQLEQADEAVKSIDRREREVEVEYGAWQLLRETLQEAEAEDAVHLGKALVEPVSQRMTELTGGPYGVSIGPTLSTEGVDVAGSRHELSRLSVGTQDQLATVLRLTIAEKIGSTVVLDDQLVQSDASRMRWLQEFMIECAKKFQILVLTCRPEEYEVGGQQSLRSIDLTEHIERSE